MEFRKQGEERKLIEVFVQGSSEDDCVSQELFGCV